MQWIERIRILLSASTASALGVASGALAAVAIVGLTLGLALFQSAFGWIATLALVAVVGTAVATLIGDLVFVPLALLVATGFATGFEKATGTRLPGIGDFFPAPAEHAWQVAVGGLAVFAVFHSLMSARRAARDKRRRQWSAVGAHRSPDFADHLAWSFKDAFFAFCAVASAKAFAEGWGVSPDFEGALEAIGGAPVLAALFAAVIVLSAAGNAALRARGE